MPVRERRALPQVKRPGESVGADLPALREARLHPAASRCRSPTRPTNMPCVMSVDEVSFAIIALNVLGPVVSPMMKRPP